MRLKDIIDLEYFISIDDEIESRTDIESLVSRDRKIFGQYQSDANSKKDLLLFWLGQRKQQFFKDTDNNTAPLLPGSVFSSFYTIMVYLMIILGGIAGLMTIYSFLAYHGTHPINVMVFIALFVILQIVLVLGGLLVLVKRLISFKYVGKGYGTSAFVSLMSAFVFNGIPQVLKKIKANIFIRAVDSIEYLIKFNQGNKREFAPFLFWPFYILTSIFAFGFLAGALAGTFFKVVVSDMAFGWQSTLVTGSQTVYNAVSAIAFPWSMLIPEGFAHPSFEQIEGSRIVLKDGIQALASQDLVSWWPFLCMGIICYALIPRGLLIICGMISQYYQLNRFDVERPRFNQLILRMQSPVLDIDVSRVIDQSPGQGLPDQNLSGENRIGQNALERETKAKKESRSSGFELNNNITDNSACLLLSKTAYADETIKNLNQYVQASLFLDVKLTLLISFEYEKDLDAFDRIAASGINQVILVHEVWQPPIRGILFYIRQVKAALPEKIPLCVMLTQDSGQKDLSVDSDDINFKIWEAAISKLEDPGVFVARYI